MTLKAVFFDLDGTFLDTALDLGNALNKLLTEHQKAPLPHALIRNVVSDGANALLKLGFALSPEDKGFSTLREKLLNYYLEDLASHTKPFDGIELLINNLSERDIQWGIATNKPWLYTEPLMKQFKFASDPIALICPQHVNKKKPDPESLVLACKKAGCKPQEAIYVGDHVRDIQCGINAGMPTIAVAYGYIDKADSHLQWGATYQVEHANEIWPIVREL